jgi:hypothetical protein
MIKNKFAATLFHMCGSPVKFDNLIQLDTMTSSLNQAEEISFLGYDYYLSAQFSHNPLSDKETADRHWSNNTLFIYCNKL